MQFPYKGLKAGKKKKRGRQTAAAVLLTGMLLGSPFAGGQAAYGSVCGGMQAPHVILAKAKVTPAKPKPVPEESLTGDPRRDALTVALSQVGYHETRKNGRGYSYYGGWASSYQASRGAQWCSEFSAWCIRKAGVPEELHPRFMSVGQQRNFFGPLGRVFAVEGGNKHSRSWIGDSNYSGCVSLEDVQPGDIVLVRRHGTKASSPSHTAMVRKVDTEEGIVYTVDGNVGSRPKSVMKRKIKVSHVYALIKPFYELYPVTGLKAQGGFATEEDAEAETEAVAEADESDIASSGHPSDPERKEESETEDGRDEEEPAKDDDIPAVSLSWEPRAGVTGYIILRSGKKDGEYARVAEKEDSAECGYFDTDVKDGGTYYYKVIPYVRVAKDAIVDGGWYLDAWEKDGGTYYVSAKASRTADGDTGEEHE